MVRILDEKTHAERMVEEGFLLNRKLTYELSILFKYYKSLGVGIKEIDQKLHDFCKFWLREGYNYVKFIKVIEKVISLSKNSFLKSGRTIFFTKNEMKLLEQLEDDKIRKLLFIMMFFGKVDGAGYCNVKQSEVFKLAHLTGKQESRDAMLHWLKKEEYIKPTLTGGDKIRCIDENSFENADVAFVIERFEDPLVYMIAYKDDRFVKVCEGCGLMIIGKSNAVKWCGKCREKRRLEAWKETYKKRKEREEGKE